MGVGRLGSATKPKRPSGGVAGNRPTRPDDGRATRQTTSDKRRCWKCSRLVLAEKETSLGRMFVTWESTAWLLSNGSEKADYYWGHYFDDERKARADFHRRLLEKYET